MTEQAYFLKDVVVEFNQKKILNINEVGIQAGRIHAVIGPSGAGKTTLLRVLNLLQPPHTGKVQYFGQDIKYKGGERLALQRSMSMVFQKPAIFSGDVFYNVAMGLKFRGLSREEIRKRVLDALEKVGMKELARRSAGKVSGGEAQRIALARSLVVQPKVLLLDEPTANLDPANVAIFEEIIKKVHEETRTTVVMITHNLYQAKRLSQEAIFLNKGEIIEISSTNDLFTNPQHNETKQFISGEMIY